MHLIELAAMAVVKSLVPPSLFVYKRPALDFSFFTVSRRDNHVFKEGVGLRHLLSDPLLFLL
jgi:hypothetical protein